MNCHSIIDQAIKKLDVLTLLELYKKNPDAYLEEKLFNPIRRFRDKDYRLILLDLENRQKEHHWMWWGFPLSFGWWDSNPSSNAVFYSLKEGEAYLLLNLDIFRNYYIAALNHLLKKKDLLLYFGPLDYFKFRLHISYFLEKAKELKDKKIISLLSRFS